MIWLIYIVSITYCIWRMSKGYKKAYGAGNPIGPTPGLETLFIIPFAPFLAVIDASLTWVRWMKEYESSKKRDDSL